MAKFAYNDAENVNVSYMPFELNCGYYFLVSYKKNINPYFSSKTTHKLLKKFNHLMTIYCEKLHHAKIFLKKAYNKNIWPKSYASGDKLWLNNKYIQIKQNQKLKAKFFKPFLVLQPVDK